MKKIKAFLRRLFAPQANPAGDIKILLFAAGIYLLLLIWAIVFKFSVISAIKINAPMSLGERFFNGFHFLDFLLKLHQLLFLYLELGF